MTHPFTRTVILAGAISIAIAAHAVQAAPGDPDEPASDPAAAAAGSSEGQPPATQPGVPADSLRIYDIDDVIIQRTRTDREVGTVPFANLEREGIDQTYFGQDVPMVLGQLPSAYAFSDAGNGFGYTYLRIRGFEQNRIGMLLNGVPLNDPEQHQVYWVDHANVLAGASSVQVQRGIGTTLFGATSFGGSVDVLTSPLAVPAGLTLETRYGDFTDPNITSPTRVVNTSFASGPIVDGKIALYGRYSRIKSDGYRFQSGVDQESYALSALYSGKRSGHKFDVYSGSEITNFAWDGISPQFGFDLRDRDDRRFNPYAVYENNIDSFRQTVSSITSQFELGGGSRLSNTLYYVTGKGFFEQFKEGENFFDYGLDPIAIDDSTTVEETDLVRRRWVDNHYWGLAPELTYPIARGMVAVGASLRFYEADHYGDLVWTDVDVPAPPLDRYYALATQKVSGELWARIQYQLRPSTILTGALQLQMHRYDWTQQQIGNFAGYEFQADHDFLSPRLGIRQSLFGGMSAYASVSRAKREPAESDYVDGDDPTSVPAFENADTQITGLTNPLVRSEEVTDYELGLRLERRRLRLEVAAYRLDFENELIPIDGGRIFEENRLERANANATRHEGIEFDGMLLLPLNLRVGGNASWARHRFIDHEVFAYWLDDYAGGRIRYDGNVIPRSPELLANLRAGWEPWAFAFGAEAQHVGKQYVDSENTESLAIDAFTVFNATVGVDVGRALGSTRVLRVEVRVNNVLDTLYETFGYSYYDDFPARPFAFYWPAASRSVFAGVKLVL